MLGFAAFRLVGVGHVHADLAYLVAHVPDTLHVDAGRAIWRGDKGWLLSGMHQEIAHPDSLACHLGGIQLLLVAAAIRHLLGQDREGLSPQYLVKLRVHVIQALGQVGHGRKWAV